MDSDVLNALRAVLKEELKPIAERLDSVADDVTFVRERIIAMELDHGKKLDLLLDGVSACNDDIRLLREELREHETEIEQLKAIN